jgi:hypothetical protein
VRDIQWHNPVSFHHGFLGFVTRRDISVMREFFDGCKIGNKGG